MSDVTITGLTSALTLLDTLGKQGDRIARDAATNAARTLRAEYLTQALSSQTGVSVRIVRSRLNVKKATQQYPAARVNFSGAGVLVRDYKYTLQRVSGGGGTRARLIVNWVGGKKLAAGFANPRGSQRTPLATRNSKTTSRGKTYNYRTGKMVDALGPSMAAAYLAMPQGQVSAAAEKELQAAAFTLIDEVLNG